ncbi:hypothetical protein OS190_19055 [Sulfitobacter sp. F26204]|uniref:hypothetical protein n=1 Tax=Sulfitobacter sp. F26204 TaxID=2996014 RepID=UPI00225E11ED|nr:hypothetical protein [Sulfitobacter sp. F26204]MCX7561667.1 hypothetical protein [Sulfitobacter sp. F26204]
MKQIHYPSNDMGFPGLMAGLLPGESSPAFGALVGLRRVRAPCRFGARERVFGVCSQDADPRRG